MESTILRSEALKQADNNVPFDLVFISCDRRRGTGGELIVVKGWQKMDTEHPHIATKADVFTSDTAERTTKNPNHWDNKTINIHNPNNRSLHTIKVHFRLIQFFNGKRVING